MAINFKSINLEVIDISTNSTPDIFVNLNGITFSKRVLEDLNYPQNVQYCVDAASKVFAIRVCKGNDAKATPFSKPKSEQNTTLTCGSKNLREIIITLIPNYNPKKRYKLTGEYDSENRVMYFDMATAEESALRNMREE
jgi:5'(3')-deoxyribonucleotidase